MMRLPIVAVSLLLSCGYSVAADSIPRLDVRRTCRDAYDVLQDTSQQRQGKKASEQDVKQAFDACMASENSARDAAAQRWARIRGENRRTCVTMASAMFPSYVELDACLQMYDEKDPSLSGNAPMATTPPRR